MLLKTKPSANWILIILLVVSTQLFSQQELTTAEIETINSAQTASQGDMYLDVELDLLYIGLSSGKLRKISDKETVVDGQPLPDVSKPLIHLDTSPSTASSTSFVTIKSFVLPGDILKSQNAINMVFYKRRNSNSGSLQIRLRYGGQELFTTGNLSNAVGRVEMALFASGSSSSQRAYIDDANTGNNGQRTGTSSVNSSQDQLVEIQVKVGNSSTQFTLDFLSVEGLIFE